MPNLMIMGGLVRDPNAIMVHESEVSGTTVSLEAVPSQRTKRYHRSA